MIETFFRCIGTTTERLAATEKQKLKPWFDTDLAAVCNWSTVTAIWIVPAGSGPHTHGEGDITNLTNDLDGKLAAGHVISYNHNLLHLNTNDHANDYTSIANKPTIPVDVSGKKYMVQTADAALPNAQAMGVLGTGLVKNTATTGVQSITTPRTDYANYAVAATPATTGTMTVNMNTADVFTITPTGACTFNASGGVAGQRVSFSILTSGTTSYTLTWGANFKVTGTLATGTVTAKYFTIDFICRNGTLWVETGRTVAM